MFGASTSNITKVLIYEFIKQMVFAALVFGPITLIVFKEFLRNFAYATPLLWTDSIYPLLFCICAVVALSWIQSIKLNRDDLTSSMKD